MKKTVSICCFILFLIFCSSRAGNKDSLTYTQAYNLNFRTGLHEQAVYPWMEHAAFAPYSLAFAGEKDGKTYYTKKYFPGTPGMDRLKFEIMQRIALPAHEPQEGRLTLVSKGENIEWIRITVRGIDKREEEKSRDTLRFMPGMEEEAHTLDFALGRSEILDIQIHAEGEKGKEATIGLIEVRIKLGDTTLDAYPLRIPSDVPRPVRAIPVGNLRNFSPIGNKKITALGESLHYDKGVKSVAHELLYGMVEQGKARLLLVEMPMELALLLDRYAQGGEVPDSVLGQLAHHELAERLRSFNQKKKATEKVHLSGVDYEYTTGSAQGTDISLFDFVVLANREVKTLAADQLAVLLMERQEWQKVVGFIDDNEEALSQVFTPDELACIRHILALSGKMGKDNIRRKTARDSVMAINARFLIERFAPRLVDGVGIYAHAAHANMLSTYPAIPCKPFGAYMRRLYGDDYASWLLLTDNPIQPAPSHSVENSFRDTPSKLSYLSLTPAYDRLLFSRFEGASVSPQTFFLFNLYRRYDHILFIRQDAPASERKRLTNKELMDRHIRVVKQRASLLKELKMRIQSETATPDLI